MNSKSILIVTKFFHPEITPRAFRAFELAKQLAKQGHDITILTTKKNFDYSELEKKYNFEIKAIVKNEPDEIQGAGLRRVLRYSLLYFFQLPFSYLTFYFKKALKHENKNYDLMVSIAHPFTVHFGVALAKEKNNLLAKIWIADCGDPFAGSQHGRFPYPFYYKWIEKWFCTKVDYLTVPIVEAKDAYPKCCQKKIKIIPQGFDFSMINPNYKEDMNSVPTFAYAGNLSPGLRDPRPLLDLLYRLKVDFRFIIYTRNKGFIIPYKNKLFDKLEIRDYVPRNTLLKELGQMDFLINLENRGSTQQPSKLIDYALLKRPVLSIPQSSTINEEKVTQFLNGNYNQALIIQNIEQYNIINVANNFLKLIKKH